MFCGRVYPRISDATPPQHRHGDAVKEQPLSHLHPRYCIIAVRVTVHEKLSSCTIKVTHLIDSNIGDGATQEQRDCGLYARCPTPPQRLQQTSSYVQGSEIFALLQMFAQRWQCMTDIRTCLRLIDDDLYSSATNQTQSLLPRRQLTSKSLSNLTVQASNQSTEATSEVRRKEVRSVKDGPRNRNLGQPSGTSYSGCRPLPPAVLKQDLNREQILTIATNITRSYSQENNARV